MIQASSSFSRERHAPTAAQNACRRALTKLGTTRADIAFVFSTLHHTSSFEPLLKTVASLTGARHILGASGRGLMTEACEIENGPGVAVLLINSDELEAVSFMAHNLQESSHRAGLEAAEQVKTLSRDPSALFLLADHYSFQSPLFFEGLESLGGYVPVIGATASDDGSTEKTYQFHDTRPAFDAAAGLALAGPLRIETGLTQSCLPYGEPLKITRSRGHLIYELEGRPAYDIFLEHLSRIESEDPEKACQDVLLGLPLSSFQTRFAKPNYVVHNITEVNTKNGMISCTAPVEEGEFLTFAVRDAAYARQDMDTTLADLRSRIGDEKPAFGLYFNCVGRGKNLYGSQDQDIAMIRRAFPDMPLLGFFAYSELAPVDFVNHIHHYSGVLSLAVPQL